MYCNQCGAQNSDNARFCFKCGSPISHPEPNIPQSQNAPATNLDYILVPMRKMFIDAAVAYEKKGGETPFDFVQDQLFIGIASDPSVWKNVKNEQIDLLVRPHLFSSAEQQTLSDEPVAILTYFDMIRAVGLSVEVPNLAIGALETKMLLSLKQMQGLAEEKNWKAYETWASELVEQAREVGSPHLLAIALWKATTAKFAKKDKLTCRTLLDELDSVIATALRKQPTYSTIEGGEVDINSLVKAAQRDSVAMRKAL